MTDIATLVKCTIPANPDIAGIGVRTAIYVQNFLCIIPAIAALWDGKVTQGELDYAEMQTTTNLVLAFAILISSIVQARTLGMTNYHANIVLLMSWMNNTNAFIYFILYIHHKLGPSEQKERVDFSWKSWVTHVKERFSSPPETLSQMTRQVERGPKQSAKVLIKRFVLTLGSLHLTLMAALGLWLWSDLTSFGIGLRDTQKFQVANQCALTTAHIAVVGQDIPFQSQVLRKCSLFLYAIFLVPGANLVAPMCLFLGVYTGWTFAAQSNFLLAIQARSRSFIRQQKLKQDVEIPRGSWYRSKTWAKMRLAHLGASLSSSRTLPAFIGLAILLAVNVVFIADIEITLQRNSASQDKEETDWGFGQILAILLLLLPLRDLIEAILARRLKQRQQELDYDLQEALRKGDVDALTLALQRGGSTLPTPGSQLAAQLWDLVEEHNLLNLMPALTNSEEAAALSLHEALQHQRPHVARYLIQSPGTPLDWRNPHSGEVALAVASREGNEDTVKLLLEHPSVRVDVAALDGSTPLMHASREGHDGVVKVLLRRSRGLANAADSRGRTPLMFASASGHQAIAAMLLEQPETQHNAIDIFGTTALMLASRRGHTAIARMILARPGCRPDLKDKMGNNALMHACAHGRADTVQMLLLQFGVGAHANLSNNKGFTALMLAAERGHEAVIRLLLAQPDDAGKTWEDTWENSYSRGKALLCASKHGYDSIVSTLLEQPLTPSHPFGCDWNPDLIAGAKDGYDTIARVLLEQADTDPNAVDEQGVSALAHAASSGYETTVRMLPERFDTWVNWRALDGSTALMRAAEGGRTAISRLLLERPDIDRNAADSYGTTALIHASSHGHESIAGMLLEHPDIQPNLEANNGTTPLKEASYWGHTGVVQLLLAHHATLVNHASDGRTPLMQASRRGNAPVVAALLQHPDISVNQQDKCGNTALMDASGKGHEETVAMLLRSPGIDTKLESRRGETAMSRAVAGGHQGVVGLLQEFELAHSGIGDVKVKQLIERWQCLV